LALNTSTLAAGTYTGSVTVNCAANVADAPQTITVTVRIGALNVYVAPGATSDVSFYTSSLLTGSASTQDGNRWLSLYAAGSFRFAYPYSVHVAPPASMAQGTYNGSLVTSGSSFAPENQTIPVTMRITTQPIAQAYPAQVTARLAQGAAPLAMQISLHNLGQGSLSFGTVSATTSDGGTWLTASANAGGWAALTLDPGTLAASPIPYTGSVSIASNAVNGTVIVPVSFQVVAKGAPLANYMGVVDNAIFGSGDAVARGDIVDVFGEQFWFGNIAFSSGVPLATQITASGSTSSVLVNGLAAPLYFSSYSQIAFQVPMETALGTAQVQVQRDGISGNIITVQVVDRAPRILITKKQDGNVPDSAHPAHVGDVLTIWAIGLGATNPAVGTNVPAPGSEPLARLISMPSVEFGSGFFGSVSVTPAFAGLSPGSVGLYQVNAAVPQGVSSGLVNVTLVFPDGVSNTVQVAVQ
jgi:uncharacterized protein (TIGR03437 family)